MDAIVLMSRRFSSLGVQEILRQVLETEVYEYILDRIDDTSYDPLEKMWKMSRKDCRRGFIRQRDIRRQRFCKKSDRKG